MMMPSKTQGGFLRFGKGQIDIKTIFFLRENNFQKDFNLTQR